MVRAVVSGPRGAGRHPPWRRAGARRAEPAGAIGLAALLRECAGQRGRRVAVVLTGGNVDTPTLAAVRAGRTPSH